MNKNKKHISVNKRKNIQKNKSSSILNTQNSKIINITVNKKHKKKRKVSEQNKLKNNLQNGVTTNVTKSKKRKNKLIQPQIESTKVTNEQTLEKIINKKNRKKEKRKLKRLQNKPTFKLDQQTEVPVNKIKNSKVEKQVQKDLLNVKSAKTSLNGKPKISTASSLRERMQNQLKSSRFRYLNEQLYTIEGKEAKQLFQSDRDSFEAYHEGFRQQVSKWPMNPLDKIIAAVKKMPTDHVVADFGCGEAKLGRSVPHKVHSFDLLETVPGVIACDMAHCKLPAGTVDVAVFCLSLMGTNLHDYLAEANRVLKIGGVLKIAEVESRFNKVENFIQVLQSFGFKLMWKDLSHNLFYFLDFKKERTIKKKNKLPTLSLQPCLYKKR